MEKNEFLGLLQTYPGISALLKNCTYQEIAFLVSRMLGMACEGLKEYPMGGYSKGKTSGSYYYVLQDMLQNAEYYDWVYDRLADDKSKEVFTYLMQFRLYPDNGFLEKAYDGINRQYFDRAIVSCDEEEVFVDCGGFIGDTTEGYIRQYGKYKRIYVYEPSSDNIKTCRDNLKKYPRVTVKKCGVGEKGARMSMDVSRSSSSFVNAGQKNETVEVVSLDEDIREKVTFIKMDIEGFEIPAILGAKNHIKNDSPKLAICTYHIISDIWEIPKLIHAINPNYRFYLRHYMKTENWETVLYAIPVRQPSENRQKPDRAAARKIVAMAPYERGWSNVELIKDCGLIPYLLYKNHGCEAIMVGAEGDRYTYLEKYIRGVKMEFLPNGKVAEKHRYIEAHACEIDALLLRGCYRSYFAVAKTYKRLNPNGRIYVGLDANSGWMDRIIWDEENFVEFMDNCDVIATSCHAMQKHLNEKWPWKIEYIPNGCYEFTKHQKPVFREKKNTILTVGRLGTEQKATEVLLEAFAKIAKKAPDWDMRLAGNVENGFDTYIEEYFKRFPKLSGRVHFIGAIADREQLFAEYRNAKIFALPSGWEGGTPNVIGEALCNGCVTAVTKFDAWEDAIDYGRCGMSAEIDDIDGFADILYRLCTAKNLEQLSAHAWEYSRSTFDMEKITARVNELLFGGGYERSRF